MVRRLVAAVKLPHLGPQMRLLVVCVHNIGCNKVRRESLYCGIIYMPNNHNTSHKVTLQPNASILSLSHPGAKLTHFSFFSKIFG